MFKKFNTGNPQTKEEHKHYTKRFEAPKPRSISQQKEKARKKHGDKLSHKIGKDGRDGYMGGEGGVIWRT